MSSRIHRCDERRDRRARQLEIRIYRLNGRIVPRSKLAKVYVCKHLPCEVNLSRLDALDIDYWNNAPDHDRELHHPELLQFFRIKRHIACTKIDGCFLDQANANTRAHRLIADIVTGFR